MSNPVGSEVLEKLFNKSSGSEVFGLFLGRIVCLPEVDPDGVRAPGRHFSILKRREKKMYIMKMSLRIQERIRWPGFISEWLSPYRACAQMKESVLFQGGWLSAESDCPRPWLRGSFHLM